MLIKLNFIDKNFITELTLLFNFVKFTSVLDKLTFGFETFVAFFTFGWLILLWPKSILKVLKTILESVLEMIKQPITKNQIIKYY